MARRQPSCGQDLREPSPNRGAAMLPAAEDAPKGHTTLGNQPRAEPDSAFRSMYAEHRPALLRLATTTRHLAIDAHRARRARPHEVELDHRLPLITSQRADASIDETGVRAAIAALPWHQRRVLTEVYYRDRS